MKASLIEMNRDYKVKVGKEHRTLKVVSKVGRGRKQRFIGRDESGLFDLRPAAVVAPVDQRPIPPEDLRTRRVAAEGGRVWPLREELLGWFIWYATNSGTEDASPGEYIASLRRFEDKPFTYWHSLLWESHEEFQKRFLPVDYAYSG